MGCFNNYGFYSRLPIEHEDEIVLIPCYYSANRPESLGPSVISGTLTPLCFPLFGTYNDYGFIKDVREDFNTRALIKAFGVKNLDEVLRLIEKFDGERFVGLNAKVNRGEASEDDKELIRLMEHLSLNKLNSRLTYVIERKEVYNKITELEDFANSNEYINYSECWDKAVEFLEKYPEKTKYWNILTISGITVDDPEYSTSVSQLNDSGKQFACGQFLDTRTIFREASINNSDSVLKKYFFDFLGFLQFIYANGGYLTESAYCSDSDWFSKKVLKYREFELSVLKRQYQHFKDEWEDEEEEDSDQPLHSYTEEIYHVGRESMWKVGDILAYYEFSTDCEGEYVLGEVTGVELDKEQGDWIYTFKDGLLEDEETLIKQETYKKKK